MTTNEYTLQDWIRQFRTTPNVVSNFIRKDAISDGEGSIMIFAEETFLSKYNAEMKPYLTRVKLTDIERQIYQFHPRKFAYDLYGFPELWYLILYANEMHSAMEFDVQYVKFYRKEMLLLLPDMIQLETDITAANEQEMTNIIVNKQEKNVDAFAHTTYVD